MSPNIKDVVLSYLKGSCLPAPTDQYLEPDGCWMMEWYVDQGRILNLSLDLEANLWAWSALDGEWKDRGSSFNSNCQGLEFLDVVLDRLYPVNAITRSVHSPPEKT